MHDLTKPQIVIVNGRNAKRAATVNKEDYNEFCLAATRERIAHVHMNKMKPCSVSEGIEFGDAEAFENYVNDIRNGKRRTECDKCWIEEEKGNISARIIGNQTWLNPWHGNSHTEIILSNNCNASCIYCNSMWSSKWRDDIQNAQNPLPSSIMKNKNFYFFDSASPNKRQVRDAYKLVAEVGKDYNKMACVGVYGGEPGLDIIEQDHVGNVLRTFYDNNSMWGRTIRYDFNTSLNYDQSRCFDIIRYFNRAKREFPLHYPILQPSIESLGELFNYVRYGNKFENFDKNIDMFCQQNIFQIEFQVSLNSFVIKDLKNLIEYINKKAESTKQEVRMKFRFVDWLPFFRLNVLDNNFKYHVDNARQYVDNNKMYFENTKQDIEEVFDNIEKQLAFDTDKHANTALEFVSWIEQERNLRLQDVNEELYNYFIKMSEN